ncbi:hypothetical protein Dsin_028097 [Dipteronia sinensis]|uniref:glutathione transferase n=1 Tax=Dipteronia sinensis TaxID=43782 RepID=A0AAD9ZRE7_9ROSI|nr:hypothetical protein Dsin_028097 [Dipteronia sinensis]
MEGKVVLLDLWASTFAMRVRIALAEKGIKYESKEENLFNKSAFLLEMNPIHKKVPVLVHVGKPICESLVIVEYIDEVWHDRAPLPPSDPYQRSQARIFKYLSQEDVLIKGSKLYHNIYGTGRRVRTGKGEDKEIAKKELLEYLKTMEGKLGDKHFFGGDNIGFVDVALVPITS